jgi:hypothetical protein
MQIFMIRLGPEFLIEHASSVLYGNLKPDLSAPVSWPEAQRKSDLQALDIFRTRPRLRFA